jgi:DNA-directed RNA polymerase specialized sigma24 family protein
MCTRIVHGADRGPDIFQACCAQFLRHDIEGPPASPNTVRASSLRTANLHTLGQFLAYFYKSAQYLDNSLWAKEKRRQELMPTYDITVADLARARAEGVSSEDRQRLVEALEAVGSLDEKYRFTFLYSMVGYTVREIAQMMGCSHVAVEKRLKFALRKALGREVLPIRKAS